MKDSERKDSKINMHSKWEFVGFILTLLSSCAGYKPANFTLWNLIFLSAIFVNKVHGWALCNRTDVHFSGFINSFPTKPPVTWQIHRVFLQYAKYYMYQSWQCNLEVYYSVPTKLEGNLRSNWVFRLWCLHLNLLLPCGGFVSHTPLNFMRSLARTEDSTGHRASLMVEGCPCGFGPCNCVNVFNKFSCAQCG